MLSSAGKARAANHALVGNAAERIIAGDVKELTWCQSARSSAPLFSHPYPRTHGR